MNFVQRLRLFINKKNEKDTPRTTAELWHQTKNYLIGSFRTSGAKRMPFHTGGTQ
jgi:hypothetical protein